MSASTPKCVACYEPAESDPEHLVVCPAGVICGRCSRIARGEAPYWLYTGSARTPHAPVVVQARSLDEAVQKVLKSHMYDGGDVQVWLVVDFEKFCRTAAV